MAIMTKEKDRPSQTSRSDNPFGLSDEAMKRLLKESRQAGEEVRKVREEAEKSFRELTLYCPYDNSPSRFIGYRGAYTIVRAFFRCEQGHEFAHSQGKTSPSDK